MTSMMGFKIFVKVLCFSSQTVVEQPRTNDSPGSLQLTRTQHLQPLCLLAHCFEGASSGLKGGKNKLATKGAQKRYR